MTSPLADRMRPQELSEVVGQEHLVGKNGVLRRLLESGNIPKTAAIAFRVYRKR